MSKLSHPRHGSLAFSPRKRARKLYFSPRAMPAGARLGGFAGFKAAMTQISAFDAYKNSPSFQQTVALAATIIECPPLTCFAVRGYEKTISGLRCVGEAWAEKTEKRLARKTWTPAKPPSADAAGKISSASLFRLLVHTNPKFKKTPEVFEIAFNGPLDEARAFLGKQIKVADVFKEGDFVDVLAVTKGHGTEGPVRRWGARIQYRKAHGKRRHVGAINPWHPARVMWTSLQAGQRGTHRRTELNKRVLKIGADGAAVTPRGGSPHYGLVTGDYVILKGSVAGAKKRAVFLRPAIRRPRVERAMPEVKAVSTRSQQGR
jgi:large subunit ribosomal protein L3